MTLRTAAVPLAAIILSTPVAVLAQEGQVVSDVQVRGVTRTNADVVLAAARLKPGVPFTNDAFNSDKLAIRALGLYSLVGGRTETTPDGKLRVIYEVVENPVITKISFTGNKAISEEKLLSLVRSQPGEVLNTVRLNRDVQEVLQYYADQGYVAFIPEEARIDPKTGVLVIPVVETVVESVTVTGNKKTKPFVILREMRTKPGEVFNLRTLQRDLSKVYGLGIFEDISPPLREPGSDVGKVRLTIPVVERRTGQVAVGFGYSSRERLVGRLELSELNFRGRGQGLNFLWEVGGIASRNSFEVGFSEPWIDRRNTSLSVNVYDRVLYRFSRSLSTNATAGQDDDPYFERRKGGSLTMSRPFGDTTRGYLTLRGEDISANNLDVNFNALTDEEINSIRGSLVQDGNVTSGTLRTVVNTRDNDLDPASGMYLAPSLELGNADFTYQKPRVNPDYVSPTATPGIPRVLVENRSERGGFAKYGIDVRRYISLSGARKTITEPKRVLAGRLIFGSASGAIGFSEQYFVGGAETLRGYPEDRFWGNNLLLASLEYRTPFDNKGTVTGVLFVDVGDAWGATDANREDIKDFEQHKNFSPHAGFGLGVRLKTPIGPVRLDYGIGQGNRTHFSIGQAF